MDEISYAILTLFFRLLTFERSNNYHPNKLPSFSSSNHLPAKAQGCHFVAGNVLVVVDNTNY